ncbi:MAG: TIGR02450 family Trp-rich protein [Pseudomonadales bacterium]|nr:TIGR02450 family Trp-rich protein [Pseudomonadales bacterium]MDG1441588.1 TIGR02450 family Trp-rich protein [Pseudomonadales bacterium]
MNRINPKKLLRSKWTAVSPINKEKHFLISELEFDEQGDVSLCQLEAVISNRSESIAWQTLKNNKKWLQGWK